ncbi:DUF4406 domain-containing protein [Bordetella bronchialis]|uniref:DUF4406 domain-containing protein n=1 Tax=Bordetella bronchialis TaxID=463025 RepID=UPI003D058535
MKVYLAGPMTGLPALNHPAFHDAAGRLRARGIEVVNPAEIVKDHGLAWADCMRRDIPELVTCEAIVLLPGWEASRGARLEYTIASGLGMRCWLYDIGPDGTHLLRRFR